MNFIMNVILIPELTYDLKVLDFSLNVKLLHIK